eukprot:UN08629
MATFVSFSIMKNLLRLGRPMSWLCSTQALNPFRCMNRMSEEHKRIKPTIESFERMVHKMKETDNISEHAEDLNKFIEFIIEYNGHHHAKEAMLYSKVLEFAATGTDSEERDSFSKIIVAVRDEHSEAPELMQELFEIVKSGDVTMDDIVVKSNDYFKLVKEHLIEEDEMLYGQIAKRLSTLGGESAMEEMSQSMEYLDK